MWLSFGCMRLSTDADRDETRALEVLASALEHGITTFDTAHAYARDESDLGHNERLLARALDEWSGSGRDRASVRVVTKCGMRRDHGAWIPDGRAKRIAEDAAASAEALGAPPDLLLLHAPDPRVSLATSARALERARRDGLARGIGVSNVTRKQLEAIANEAEIAAVSIALGAYDDAALKGGVVQYCLERRIELFAHAPLGGPERAQRLARDGVLGKLAAARGVDARTLLLAWMRELERRIVPVVGARRVDTVRALSQANELAFDDDVRAAIDQRFPVLASLRTQSVRAEAPAAREGEVVILMGIPGAGKSRAAEQYVARGYERLNRDLLGGTLAGIAQKLGERLHAGAAHVVLDNTYVSRASRSDVVRVARAHGVRVRCIYFDTPPEEARVNVVTRMMERFGRVLGPEQIRLHARRDAAALAPHAIFKLVKELELPHEHEGFHAIERVAFAREHREGAPALVVALAAAEHAPLAAAPEAPIFFYAWRPDADDAAHVESELRKRVQDADEHERRVVEFAMCTHPAGPPICWCRPPMPGLFVDFAHRHRVDLRASTWIGMTPTDRSLARLFGAANFFDASAISQ